MPSPAIIYVYPDVVFAISSAMNFFILWGTNRIARLNSSTLRLGLGAAFGALYSAAASYPHLSFLHSFAIKMAFGSIMFLLTFFPLSPKRFLAGFFYFFLVSFCAGGIFFGAIFLVTSSPWAMQVGNGLLSVIKDKYTFGFFITIIAFVILTKWGLPLFKKSRLHGALKVPVKVRIDQQEVEVEALLDTGNQLQDPITMNPVIVVEYGALSSCLPIELRSFIEKGEGDFSSLAGVLTDLYWSTRFRVIPFTSLGKSNGMLVGFRPDNVEVRRGEEVLVKRDVIIGIYNKRLSPEGNYKALLHPDVLQEISA